MKPSGSGLLCAGTFLIIASISLVVISVFRFSASSWFRFGRFYVSSSLLLETDEGREGGGKRNIEVKEKHRSIDWMPPVCTWTGNHMHWDQGLNSQSRDVPWLGNKPTAFWLWHSAPTNSATIARDDITYSMLNFHLYVLLPCYFYILGWYRDTIGFIFLSSLIGV